MPTMCKSNLSGVSLTDLALSHRRHVSIFLGPGFSWYNLKGGTSPVNSIPRLGGNFMWRQAYRYVNDNNIKTIWMAQFDEVDEGTAIFKVAKNQNELPAEGTWLALNADGTALPNDWYLQLCGEAQKMLLGLRSLTSTIPLPIRASPTRSPTNNPTLPPSKKPTVRSFDNEL